jgi:hypothetical protein
VGKKVRYSDARRNIHAFVLGEVPPNKWLKLTGAAILVLRGIKV